MASYNPGTYEGTGRGYGGKLIVSVTVSVTVRSHAISEISIIEHKNGGRERMHACVCMGLGE